MRDVRIFVTFNSWAGISNSSLKVVEGTKDMDDLDKEPDSARRPG
jgi:hypothetical protein